LILGGCASFVTPFYIAPVDRGNAGWLRGMSVSLVKVGDVRLATGDRAAALSAHEESLVILRTRSRGSAHP
jgi:hypothetical protein